MLDKQKEYKKKWRSKNRDKINEYNKKYYYEHKDKKREYAKKWRKNNLEKHREQLRKYMREHPEINKKCNETFRKNHDWNKYCSEARKRRVERLREQGVTNAWNVVTKGAEPKYIGE